MMTAKNNFSKIELSLFCSQLAMLIKGGISVYEGLFILSGNAQKDKTKKRIYEKIAQDVQNGKPLSACFEGLGIFPAYFVEMTKIGETSGRLDEVLDSLAVYYEKSDFMSKTIRNALRYPLYMIFVMLVVMGVILAKALPVFSQVYEQIGAQMSGAMLAMLRIGEVINEHFVFILIAALTFILVVLILRATKRGRDFFANAYAKFILTKRIAERESVSRLAFALSLGFSSGFNIDQTVNMAEKLIDSNVVKKKTAILKEGLNNGEPFAVSIARAGIFPEIYTSMIAVGVKSGMTDRVMKTVADRFSQETDEWLYRTVSVIEPTIVIVMSVVIGMMLLSVMIPLIGIMSNM